MPRPVVAPVAEVQVHPAAQELDFIDLAFAVVLAVMLAVVPGLGAGRLAPAGSWPQCSLAACWRALRLICPRAAGTGLAHHRRWPDGEAGPPDGVTRSASLRRSPSDPMMRARGWVSFVGHE